MSEARRVRPPVPATDVVFIIEKDGARREVTIPAAQADQPLIYGGLPVVLFEMMNNGGVMRILR